ncbi:hypothetical protein [Methylobacterium sp. E-045]|uniref:hypothetical protein n=1 Tax=Methylobacterium sp. E-045 TaxID=2836575 RepID=UPI001FBBADCB|nr:hypothetical protein [Methylobacterium sp. E-045]MCJ2127588.1 hypothetical protein [Methylobacterium sp. E-045]
MTVARSKKASTEVGYQLDLFDASLEIAQSVIAHHLATYIARQQPLAFGLVRFLESVYEFGNTYGSVAPGINVNIA